MSAKCQKQTFKAPRYVAESHKDEASDSPGLPE